MQKEQKLPGHATTGRESSCGDAYSPFCSFNSLSLRKSGWEGLDKGYVHLTEGTPLPYSTRFYNTQLQGIFGLNYMRLGAFRNEGDRIELDRPLVEKYLQENKIMKADGARNIYR